MQKTKDQFIEEKVKDWIKSQHEIAGWEQKIIKLCQDIDTAITEEEIVYEECCPTLTQETDEQAKFFQETKRDALEEILDKAHDNGNLISKTIESVNWRRIITQVLSPIY